MYEEKNTSVMSMCKKIKYFKIKKVCTGVLLFNLYRFFVALAETTKQYEALAYHDVS